MNVKSKQIQLRVGQIWTLDTYSYGVGNSSFIKIERPVPKKRNYWFYSSSSFLDGPWEYEKRSSHAAEINKINKLVYDPLIAEKEAMSEHKPNKRLSRVIED